MPVCRLVAPQLCLLFCVALACRRCDFFWIWNRLAAFRPFRSLCEFDQKGYCLWSGAEVLLEVISLQHVAEGVLRETVSFWTFDMMHLAVALGLESGSAKNVSELALFPSAIP